MDALYIVIPDADEDFRYLPLVEKVLVFFEVPYMTYTQPVDFPAPSKTLDQHADEAIALVS